MVTQDKIEAKIVSESYTVLPSGKVTICELILENGFSVIGKSGVVDKSLFNEQIGQMLSRQDAINNIWPLEGYLLQQEQYNKLKG